MNARLKKTMIRTLKQYTPEFLVQNRKPYGLKEKIKSLFGHRYDERVPVIEIPEVTSSCFVHVPRKGEILVHNLAVFTRIISHEDLLKCYPPEHGWHRVYFYQLDRARQYFIDGEEVK